MANPLKVLTDLHIKGNVQTNPNDIVTVSNGAISGSSTLQVGGQVTLGGDLVAGNTSASKSIFSTSNGTITIGSSLSTASLGGSLTVGGDLVVQGTTTTLNTTELLIEDTKIQIAKNASTKTGIHEAGIYFGGESAVGAVASIQHVSGADGRQYLKISGSSNSVGGESDSKFENLGIDVGSGLWAVNLSDSGISNSMLEAFSGTINIDVDGNGAQTSFFTGTTIASPWHGYSGQNIFMGGISSSAEGTHGQQIIIQDNLATIRFKDNEITFRNNTYSKTLTEIAQGLGGGGSGISTGSYYGVRAATVLGLYSGFQGRYTVRFSGTVEGTDTGEGLGNNFFRPAIVGLTGSSKAQLLENLAYASFDVATKASGTDTWTNDLVSVQITASNSASANWYPVFVIEAPGLAMGAGNDETKLRLIVVNEKLNVIS